LADSEDTDSDEQEDEDGDWGDTNGIDDGTGGNAGESVDSSASPVSTGMSSAIGVGGLVSSSTGRRGEGEEGVASAKESSVSVGGRSDSTASCEGTAALRLS